MTTTRGNDKTTWFENARLSDTNGPRNRVLRTIQNPAGRGDDSITKIKLIFEPGPGFPPGPTARNDREKGTTMSRIKFGGQTFTNKSEAARAMFKAGKTITEVVEETTRQKAPMGYAFAHGVARRGGYLGTAAKRKVTKAVTTTADEVTIRLDTGDTVKVNRATGKVTKVR